MKRQRVDGYPQWVWRLVLTVCGVVAAVAAVVAVAMLAV